MLSVHACFRGRAGLGNRTPPARHSRRGFVAVRPKITEVGPRYSIKFMRRVPFIEGEIFHVFNRGAHKRPIFLDESDYRRFQILLLLSNTDRPLDVSNVLKKYRGPTSVKLFHNEAPSRRLVDVMAYCLMSNHFHIVLRQLVSEGATSFMRKLCTAYSMYFNKRHEHSGTLFQGKFKSSHIDSNEYLLWIFTYVHLNPVGIVEPAWDERHISDLNRVQTFLDTYKYSSYADYFFEPRPESSILNTKEGRPYLGTRKEVDLLLEEYSKGNKYSHLLEREITEVGPRY
jgi:REP element-mobilizing transposase RayT